MDKTTPAHRPLMMSIAAVERDTGLSKDTLRVWERRYEFPLPGRDAQGERTYPLDQVEKLRLIKRLLDVGHRPSRVVALSVDDLTALSERTADAQGLSGPTRRRGRPTAPSVDMQATTVELGRARALQPPVMVAADPALSCGSLWADRCLALAELNEPVALQHELRLRLNQLGLQAFIEELAAPLIITIGSGWLRGRVQVFQEHWVSHCLQQCLHAAIQSMPMPMPGSAPRVLMSTLPGEHHSMGLLMVEAWLTMEGARPINLGPQTPAWDLLMACQTYQADVLALSFSSYAPPHLITDGLADLRSKLPATTELWVGGGHPLLQRRPPTGVRVFSDVASLGEGVSQWRRAHQRPAPPR